MKNSTLLLAALVGAIGLARGASIQTYQPADVVLGQVDFKSMAQDDKSTYLAGPVGVASDPATGKVFVSDSDNNRVLRFSSMAAAQSGAEPEIAFGQKNSNSGHANQGGAAGANTLSAPRAITLDAQGRLWVADSANNRVLGFEHAAGVQGTGPDGTGGPAATIVLGQPTAGSALDRMYLPAAVAVGPDDTLWVADYGNNRVLCFKNISSKTTGSPATGLLGQPGANADQGATGPARMNGPYGLCADAAGRLWVADSGNSRVLRFTDAAATATVNGGTADAVIGQPGLSASAGSDTFDDAHVNLCTSVYLDAEDTLWVSDYAGYRVLGFPAAALALASGARATRVIGQPGLGSGGAPASPSERNFSHPWQICGGPGGSLFIADQGYNRVLRFSPTEIVVPVPAPAVPTVKITGKKNLTTTKPKLTIKGKATGQVTSVTYRIGSKPAKKAKGTASWSIQAALKPGKNKLTVTAHGPGGDSAPARLTVIRK